MSAIAVLIAVTNPETKNRYLTRLYNHNVMYATAATIKELYQMSTQAVYNGIIIEYAIKNNITSEEERDELRLLGENYPMLMIGNTNGTSTGTSANQNLSQEESHLNYFLEKSCASFLPRKMRSSERIPCNFNVMLCTDIVYAQSKLEPTTTLNISEGGCFIQYFKEWKYKDRVWFLIKELNDDTPIQGIIRWSILWGESMCLPGIGIQFENITDSQLSMILGLSRKPQQTYNEQNP